MAVHVGLVLLVNLKVLVLFESRIEGEHDVQ